MLFTSAYRQLRPSEKAYVDGYVQAVERDADRKGERVSLALHRAIPDDVVEQSRGMLDKPLVRAAIAERINDIAADRELSPQRVIKELMATGFASIGDYMEIGEDGQPYFEMTKCTPEQLSAIQSIEIEESMRGARKFKFKLHSKLDALDKLARFMGLLERDNPVWRADTAKPVQPAVLPATADTAGAADAYARLIGG